MANNFITMLQSKSILQMLINGKRKTDIAKTLGFSLNTVKKYIKQFDATGMSYHELLESPRTDYVPKVYPTCGRPVGSARIEALAGLMPGYVKRLCTTHATRQILWDEYKEKFPQGYSYSQFCEHLSGYLKQSKVVMHIEHKPGDVLQIDFAGDKLRYTDLHANTVVECPVLVCTLPFSSFSYVEALPDMSQLSLVGALNRCFEYLQGVPLNICSDNLKQVVTKSDKYEPVFSELMLRFALHYNTSLTATRIVRPRDKASVERHVGISYTSMYAYLEQREFYSLTELNFALRKYLDELNNKPMQKKSVSRKALFTEHEAPVLRPLPPEPFEVKYRTRAKVQNNHHVILGKDWHNYSVPYRYVGKQVSIEYDSQSVEVYFEMKLIALHERDRTKNGYSTLNEHRPDNHREAVLLQQTTPEDLISGAGKIGINTEKYIKGILNKEFFSQQNLKSCLGIINFAKSHGGPRVEKACGMALSGTEFNYRTIKNILENNMDKAAQEIFDKPVTEGPHANIRGAGFYFNLFKN
jgi:transposase